MYILGIGGVMAEAAAARSRPVEYYNPRPLILVLCFIWGTAVGFSLNFFRDREDLSAQPQNNAASHPVAAPTAPSELERRRQDTPNIAEVAPTPVTATAARPTIEDIEIAPPDAVLTTEGGLTGRTAAPLARRPQPDPRPPGRAPGPPRPPPIPDLFP